MASPISLETAGLLHLLRVETYKAIARCRTLSYGPGWSFVKIKDHRAKFRRVLRKQYPRIYVENSMTVDRTYVLLLDKGAVGVFAPGEIECDAISVTRFMDVIIEQATSDEENQQIVKRYIELISKL